jgi:hypothetical protein
MLRIRHCVDNRLIDGGKLISLTHTPHINNNTTTNNRLYTYDDVLICVLFNDAESVEAIYYENMIN